MSRDATIIGTRGGRSTGNSVCLFTNAAELLEAKLGSIRQAQRRVWLETYIIERDEAGGAVFDALVEAAMRGCEVALIFDVSGSPRFSLREYRPLEEAGGRVAMINPPSFWRRLGRNSGPLLYRNHRKTLVADDVGYCGGHNISNDYLGADPWFVDTTVELRGPCVRDLASVFADSLRVATGESLGLPDPPAALPDGVPVSVLAMDARRDIDQIDEEIERLLRGATHRCWLTLGYFIPDAWLRNLLIDAAARGVDVQVITAGKTDVPPARWAGQHTYSTLLDGGVRIHQMLNPALHAKNMTVDGRWSLVGSYDMNLHQRKQNPEVAVAVEDPGLSGALEKEFARHLERSREVTREERAARSFVTRSVEWASYRLMKA
jgi:cardiolipin synthase A/B